MTDKELIKQEIERKQNGVVGAYESEDTEYGYKQCCKEILNFIDSLPEEHNEDLEDEIERFLDEDENIPSYSKTARHFAKWQKEQDEKLFKDDSWNYIEENYPNISQEEKLRLYDISIKSRLAGANAIKQQMMKDANQYMYLSDEIGYAYACGCRNTMQDFLKKACSWLKENGGIYWMDDYDLPTDELINDFKNYMQNESEN